MATKTLWVLPVLAALPVAILIAFRVPFALLLAFVAFSFFRLHEAFPALLALRIPILLALGVIGVLAWKVLVVRTIKPRWTLELALLAALFVHVTFGVAFASNRSLAMDAWTGTYGKIILITFALVWLARTRDHLLAFNAVLLTCGAVIACVTLHNAALGIGLVEGTRVTIGRDIGSLLGDPNDLALVLLFPLGFASAMLTLSPRVGVRIAAGIVLALLVAALIETQSRGGLLGMLAVLGVAGYWRTRSPAFAITALFVCAVVLAALMGLETRQSGGAHEAGLDQSAQGRLLAWETALWMTLANPITGVGLNNFIANYFDFVPVWEGKVYAVHSTWLKMLAEAGLPGLFIMLTVIAVLTRRLLLCAAFDRREARGAARVSAPNVRPADMRLAARDREAIGVGFLAALAGFCVAGTFLTQAFTWPFYVLVALASAYCTLTERPLADPSRRLLPAARQ
ncbi:MAG: O-antigen ligase family protein [Pseudomonadota bacterium]